MKDFRAIETSWKQLIRICLRDSKYKEYVKIASGILGCLENVLSDLSLIDSNSFSLSCTRQVRVSLTFVPSLSSVSYSQMDIELN